MTNSNLCHSHRPYTIKEEQAYTGKDGNKSPPLQNRRTVSCPGRSQRNYVLHSSPVQSTTVTVLELRGVGSASLWFDLQTGPDCFGVSGLWLCA